MPVFSRSTSSQHFHQLFVSEELSSSENMPLSEIVAHALWGPTYLPLVTVFSLLVRENTLISYYLIAFAEKNSACAYLVIGN